MTRIFASLCALACATAAGAQPQLDPVQVTATRSAATLDATLASVEVIDAAELARLPGADLAAALRLRAGVEVARLGGPGQQTSLFLRGTESNHVLVLVDGLRINPGTIGVAAIQNIAPELVERIEIVKGPRSSLYGSDALGGVVNVITRRGQASSAAVQVGGGRYDTQSAALTATLAGERAAASLGLSSLDSGGFPTRAGDATDRGYRNRSLTASLRGEAGGVELGARAWLAAGNTEYSDFFVTPVDQDFENAALAVHAKWRPAPGWQTRITAGHARDRLEQNQSPDFLHTRRWQLDWQNDIAAGEHHALTAGLLLQREDAASESFGLGYDAATDTHQFYLQDQAAWGRHRLLLATGYTDHEAFGSHFTWNAEYGLALTDATLLTLAAGTAFRAPDATDLYGYGGNPALAPERSRSVELGLRHRAGAHRWSLVLFDNDIDELIQFIVSDFATFEGENRNVERARIRGVEAGWRYDGEDWSARASATWQDPEDLSGGTRLLRRARENLGLGLQRRIGPHELSLDLLYAGSRRDFGFPAPAVLPAYWLASASARIELAPRWTMLARIENLADEDYELARGFNTMGRSLFLALRHEFR